MARSSSDLGPAFGPSSAVCGDGLRISEAAAAFGVTVRAIRHYEDEGLVTADRTPGGARRYGPAARRRLEQIVALRRTGLALCDIRAALEGPADIIQTALRRRLEVLDGERASLLDALGGRTDLHGADCGLAHDDAADLVALRTLLDAYSQAVNQRAWGRIAELFTDDGVWSVQGVGPARRIEGRVAVAAAIRTAVEGYEFLVQMNHAADIRLQDDRATAVSTINEMGRRKDGAGLFLLGTYRDDIVRTDGAWRFSRRAFQAAYVDTTPLAGRALPPAEDPGAIDRP